MSVSGVGSDPVAQPQDFDSEPAAPQSDSGSSVEQHAATPWRPHAWETSDTGPLTSADLEAQMASNHSVSSAFQSQVGPAIDQLARQHSDPFSVFGNVNLKQSDCAQLLGALQTPQARQALGTMSSGAVQSQLEGMVEKNWPQLSIDQKHELSTTLLGQVQDQAKYDAGFGMCAQAKQMLSSSADRLDQLAKNAKQLTPQLRTKLRLDDCKPQDLPKALSDRAQLLRAQAKELDSPAGARVFRAVADHNVAGAFMRQAGIQPGSFAAKQVEAAREQGKADVAQIEHMKIACTIAAAVVTAGVGAAGVAGMATSAAGSTFMNAPGLAEKSNAVDRAVAGETAGTMRRGAVEKAKHNLHVAQAAFAGEVVLGGAAAHYGGEAAEHLVGEGAEHLAHMGIEGAAAGAAGAAEINFSQEQE